MKAIETSKIDSKIKLSLEDFFIDKIENLSAVVGGKAYCLTSSNCTDGDDGCCDDVEIDDDRVCVT